MSHLTSDIKNDLSKRKKVKSIKQLGNTGTQLEKEVAAMEEAMKQHNIEENCQKLIDGLMPQIKDMERTLYGTYHRNITFFYIIGYWYVKIILAMLIYKLSCTKLINRMVEILRHSICKIR